MDTKLIIVRGGGATGKTALARKLVADTGFESFLKDEFKEIEFDKLGRKPRASEMKKLESLSWQKTYDAVAEAIDKDKSIIIEGNFMAPQKREIVKLLNNEVEVYEVYCFVRNWSAFKRYVYRNRSGERHPGHKDHIFYPIVLLEAFSGLFGYRPYKPFKLSDKFLEVDTSDFLKVDYQKILKFIKS